MIQGAIAAALREAKGAARMSNRVIAAASGITLVSVQRYLAGTREPGVSDLIRLASALGVQATDVIRRAQELAERAEGTGRAPWADRH